MILGYDHAIHLAAAPDGLDAASARFRDLGFTVVERDDEGRDTAATVQTLVPFADGSYIEILAIRGAEARGRHRFASRLAAGDGWVDHSVWTDDLPALRTRLDRAGLPYGGPVTHERRLRSGAPWAVTVLLPGIGGGHPALPFLVEDATGRAHRIPGQGVAHANGATGIAGIVVAVAELDAAVPGYETLFGPSGPADVRLHESGRALRFPIGRHWVDLVERPGIAADGMTALILTAPGTAGVRWLATGRDALALVGGA